MQPPQNPYEPPREQQPPTYPQQNYGQQPNYAYQQPYAGGYHQTASAGGVDILMGVLLILMSLGGILFGGLALLGAGAIASGAAGTRSASFGNLPTWIAGGLAVFAGVFLVWSILMLISAIGIIRFKKWAMIMTGIMALISTAFWGWSLIQSFSSPAAGQAAAATADAQKTGMVTAIVFVAISLLFTIYGFARAGAAN